MASKYDGATLEVINWDTYNPRSDSKRPTWFRFENNIATGPGFFDLDCEIKWLWVFILSLVSQKSGEPIVWNSAYSQSITGIKQQKQDEAIEVFEKFVRLRVSREVTNSVPIVSTPLRTNERTNNTGCALEFEKLYEAYPKRKGTQRKQDGLKVCRTKFNTPEKYASLLTAIGHYAAYCDDEKKTGTAFVAQFATFLNGIWEEYLTLPVGLKPALKAKSLEDL